MRIALLNLPVDNNYGGNLQRYALMKVLQNMGHTPIHLYLRNDSIVDYPLYRKILSFCKRLLMRVLGRACDSLWIQHPFYVKMREIFRFYNCYIPHTKRIFSSAAFKDFQSFDAYIVGSDQVWRARYARKVLKEMFLGFLTDEKKRRIAYGASFGTDIDEYTCEEKETCGNLFRKFSGVSVREESALNILRKFGWNTPSAIRVVDPTLLLDASEYEKLIDKIKTVRPSGNVFCYILDDKQDLRNYIDQFCSIHKMKPYYCTLNENVFPSIEQWLRNFKDSEYVITDSYHGVIFSLIFRKPFTVYENVNRGSARIMELKRLFGIKAENFQLDVSRITDIINIERSKATTFLNNSLQ